MQQNLILQYWNSAVSATLLLEVARGARCVSSGLSPASVTVIKKENEILKHIRLDISHSSKKTPQPQNTVVHSIGNPHLQH